LNRVRGRRLQHVAVEGVAQQRWFGAVARRHSSALIRLNQIVREPRRGRPEHEYAFPQAVADGISPQHGAGAAADLDADSGAFHLHIVDLHHALAQQYAYRKRHLRIRQDAEAAEARPLDPFGDDGRSVAHGRGAQFRLARNARPQRPSAMAAGIVVVPAIPRGAIPPGAGCHIVRVSHPSATAATNPAANSSARAAHGLPPVSVAATTGVLYCSPSTTSTETLTLPPARSAAAISSRTAPSGLP